MKNTVIVSILSAALLSASSVFAADCPDFTGTFQLASDPTEVTLTVTQDKCDSVTFSYLYPANGEQLGKTYPLDNVRRETYEDQTIIVYETSGIQNNALVNLVEDYDKASATTATATSSMTIDSSGNLNSVDDSYDATGKLVQSQDNYFTRVAK
jgi:hypothetical protein